MPGKKRTPEDTRQYMQAVRKDIDKRLTDLKAELDDVQKQAVKTVNEKPLLALGVVFMIGVAVGIAIANAGD